MNWIAKNRIWIAVGVALVAVLLVVAVVNAQTGTPKIPSTGINLAGSGEVAVPGGAPAPLVDSSAAGVVPPTGASGSSGSGSSGGSSSKSKTPPAPGVVKPGSSAPLGGNPPVTTPRHASTGTPPRPTFTAKVVFWNDAGSKAPVGAFVSLDSKTWRPDITKAKDTGALGPFVVGRVYTLYVYPDGAAGKAFPVSVHFTPVMQSNSTRDAINVDVTASSVRVLGNPVQNFDVTADRK